MIRDTTKAYARVHHKRLTFDKFKACRIANWHSPVLLIDGDDDRNVPFQKTTDLVEKLDAQKVESLPM